MNLVEGKMMRQSLISTSISFVGCSLGSIGTILFLSNEHWFFILVVSFGSGLITSIIAEMFWEFFFRKKNQNAILCGTYHLSIQICIQIYEI